MRRGVDLALAGLGLVLLSPVIALTALAVRWALGRPVLFRHPRAGLGGRPFVLVKFRTMTDARDASGALLPDGARLTRLGRLLRSTSLDELPTLWNVVRGDMNLVGPRPLLIDYLDRYSPRQARRHEVRPGITGWAQIHGRNALGWDERLELDVWYVEHRSASLDLRILLRTAGLVLRREGIGAAGHPTCPEFTGSPGRERP